jgi:hypothetical protein
MKLGSFLLGGMVGAAAVVYLSTKNKAMLLSAFNSNNSAIGNTMAKAKERFKGTFDNEQGKGEEESNHKEKHSSKPDFGKVEGMINKDPQLKATIGEILAENQHKEMNSAH